MNDLENNNQQELNQTLAKQEQNQNNSEKDVSGSASQDDKDDVSNLHRKELMKENEKKRLRIRELEKEVNGAKEKEKQLTVLEEKIAAIKQNSDQRIVAAELRNAAKEFGLRDISDLRVLDMSNIKVDEAGNVTGINELMQKAKDNKPYLFEQINVSSSSNLSAPSPATNVSQKNVFKMTSPEREIAYRKVCREIASKIPFLSSNNIINPEEE